MSTKRAIGGLLWSQLIWAPALASDNGQNGGDQGPTYYFSLFSENEILTRFDRRTSDMEFIAQYNVMTHGAVSSGIAIVAGREMVLDSDDRPLLDSNDFGGLALRVSRHNISASAEARYASDLKSPSDKSDRRNGPDHRLRVNRWRKTTIPLKSLSGFSFLNESWIDAEWLPYRDNNGVFNAADILGVRGHISPVLTADVYVQPYVLLDANRTYDRNRLEMRATTRLGLSTGNITLQVSASAVHNYDLPRGDFTENEHKKSEWSRRFALTLFGSM